MNSSCISAEKLKATDEQIIEWAERHGILNGITDLMGLRCAFDDARTLLNSEPAGGDGLYTALKAVQDKLRRDNPYAPADGEGKPTWFDIQKIVNTALSGYETRPTRQAGEWLPIETAPKDGNKFVALKVTIVDEYDDEYSRDIPIRKDVELVEPVLMQWVQFAKFVDGQFMEIPYKMYRNPVRYIGWSPIPPQPKAGDV